MEYQLLVLRHIPMGFLHGNRIFQRTIWGVCCSSTLEAPKNSARLFDANCRGCCVISWSEWCLVLATVFCGYLYDFIWNATHVLVGNSYVCVGAQNKINDPPPRCVRSGFVHVFPNCINTNGLMFQSGYAKLIAFQHNGHLHTKELSAGAGNCAHYTV